MSYLFFVGGDHNIGSDGGDLFTAVQKAIATGGFSPPPPEPAHIPKATYGSVTLTESALLFENLASLGTCNAAVSAGASFPSMEDLKSWYGFVLYHTSTAAAPGTIATTATATATAGFDAASIGFTSINTHDRVQVFVDNAEVGSAYRADGKTNVAAPAGKTMGLLLENMGRCVIPPVGILNERLHMHEEGACTSMRALALL